MSIIMDHWIDCKILFLRLKLSALICQEDYRAYSNFIVTE